MASAIELDNYALEGPLTVGASWIDTDSATKLLDPSRLVDVSVQA